MTIVGFEQTCKGNIVEYLPESEQLQSKNEQRRMFLHMFNTYVDQDIKLSNDEILSDRSLYKVFENKIEKMLFSSCILRTNKQMVFYSFDLELTIVIKKFTQNRYRSRLIRLCLETSALKKLISAIYGSGSPRLLCDLDDMFLHLVYERAKLVNKKNEVLLLDKTIIIKDYRKDVSSTLLIPAYAKVNKEKIYCDPTIEEHLKTVLSTLKETKIRQIYLVYPKNLGFKRHIEIKLLDKIPLGEKEYRVKMIPYSFSFCTKKQKTKIYKEIKCQ
ncbi:MAG: hypothetical protein HF962_06690 [Sulfurovum sp.]|nr:hypothetical protein [Sulfurovum sp.]